jgi:hypothetical protein
MNAAVVTSSPLGDPRVKAYFNADDGKCRQPSIPPEWFFPLDTRGKAWNPDWDKALHICNGSPGRIHPLKGEPAVPSCPIRLECAEFAEETGVSGVWGGMVFRADTTKLQRTKMVEPLRVISETGRQAMSESGDTDV